MSVIIDTTQAIALAIRQAAAGAAFAAGADRVVGKTALEVKNRAAQTVRDADGGGRLVHYPRAISYDREGFGASGEITYVVGPDKDRMQGALGNILEYGTSRHGPVVPHLGPALESEAPVMQHFLAELGEGLA